MYTREDLLKDIPLDLAIAAHNNTSHVPERRGESERIGWADMLSADYAHVIDGVTDLNQAAELNDLFKDYHDRLLIKKLDLLRSHSNLASTMITGGSNFPAARMQKKNAAYDKKVNEYLEWRQKALSRMKRRYTEPTAIRTGSANAVEQLQAKIAQAEMKLEHMRAVNALIRKHLKFTTEEKAAVLIDELDLTPGEAKSILTPDVFGGIGYQHFEITNLAANVKRMKDQLVKAQQLAGNSAEDLIINDVKIVDNQEEDRLQVFFPVDRVSSDIYAELKSHGFRWTPSKKCFQAFRGSNANYWAKIIAGKFTV